MNDQTKKLGELCKQVSLKLTQLDKTYDVELYGDVLSEDCLIIASNVPLQPGLLAELQVNFLEQSFAVMGEIESCDHEDDTYKLHFKLSHQDSLQTRMLLQLSEIELYRHEMANKGRDLSIDQAACEWVDKFAAGFAQEFDS